MTRNEQQMYSDVSSIAKSLEKIANVLEHMNHDSYLAKQEIPKFQDIPGFEGTKDALDNLCNVSTKDEEYDFDVHNDYLNDLVQGMNHIEYLQFHDQMNFSFASNDSTAMSNAIYELEYEECLGAIEAALLCTGDSDYISAVKCTPGGEGRKYVEELLEKENTTQPTNDPDFEAYHANLGKLNNNPPLHKDDPYTYEPNPNRDKGEPALLEYLDGVKNDSDYDVRVDAKYYYENLECNDLGNPEAYKFRTKKDCILDYVTTSFRDKGARYTDVIKFAYYLGAHNAPKYSNYNRGYYSCAFSPRMDGHLIQGGKDFLVKGINSKGKERYFAHSSVNKFTDYYKRIQ